MSLLNHALSVIILLFSLLPAITSCSDAESFTIEGTVEGNPTINMRFIYFSNGRMVKGLTAAREGKFEYRGSTLSPTVVEILDNEYRPMGCVYVANGERIQCKLTRNDPFAITAGGNDITSRWADWLRANAGELSSPSSANAAVERYVASHPSDLLSTLLMLHAYDASGDAVRADSVMMTIASEARPGWLTDGFNSMLQRLVASVDTVPAISAVDMRDSLVDIDLSGRPYNIIVISHASRERTDSVVPMLRKYSTKQLRRRVHIADISTDRDTASWHSSVKADTASWQQLWVAGSLATPGINRLGIQRQPWIIITDSTGCRLSGGASVAVASAFLDSLLHD